MPTLAPAVITFDPLRGLMNQRWTLRSCQRYTLPPW